MGFRKLQELTGPPDKPMVMPTDVAIGVKGQVYVVDSGNNRILVFAEDGAYLFTFGSPGEGEGQLLGPVGITTASDGSVLVADRGNHRIQVFDADGKFLKSIATHIGKQKVAPVDIVLGDNERHLYVTISAPIHRVFVYNNKGRADLVWGKPGSNLGDFRYPAAIALGTHDDIYVVDVFNSRVQVFDFSGKVLATVGSWGVTPGKLFRPKGVTIREDGVIFVSDSYLGVIQVFNADTRYQSVLGNKGDIGYFDTPTGLATDGKKRLYVAEMLANRVSVLRLDR
ncbi:NHL repeat-containing protein [Thiolapillus sp.]